MSKESVVTPGGASALTSTILEYLPELELKRLGPSEEAGLWLTSLPWPRTAPLDLALASGSAPAGESFCAPLGQWPDEPAGTPRRLLFAADGGSISGINTAPDALRLSTPALAASGSFESIDAEMELFESSPHDEYIWERHLLRLRYGSRSVGLAMGLRTGDEVHWWEACRLTVEEAENGTLLMEMGGAIPLSQMSFEDFKKYPGVTNPYLHKHNWLSGHIYARFHPNGVCEIYAHHINSKFFDDGLDLKNAVPVIGIRQDGQDGGGRDAGLEPLCGPWDGTVQELSVGDARLDLSEVSRLSTPRQPGQVLQDGGFLVLQPYQGMELFGGTCPVQLINDSFIFRAEQETIPRGMARTLRFSLSLSDRSPRVARYLAPAWWYGVCEEFLPAPLLPISNEDDAALDAASQWVLDHIIERGFEDGSLPRNRTIPKGAEEAGRREPGWEGEIPYGEFLRAWRTGDAVEYETALRASYYFTDVCVDHAAKAVRMHGYPPNAFSVPMNRMQCSLAAYLETGDAYLLEAARAVTANSYWTHMNSWPRLAVGRDACFVRSAVLLFRYTGEDFYRRIAHEGARTAIESQRPNGSFGDQGGGAGLHQWGGYITKPWMGMLATGGVLDYLELFPDEAYLLEGVRRFADWLMAERHKRDGVMTWSYQHDFNGARKFYNQIHARYDELPGPQRWFQESMGRLFLFCSERFNDPRYLDAWAESHADFQARNDHGISATLQFLPWVQARLWNATLSDAPDRAQQPVFATPLNFGPRTPRTGTVLGPRGAVEMQLE